MSRVVRKQLFSMVEILQESQMQLKEFLENDDREQSINLLSECQDAAIMIGNQIEAIYGEGYQAVSILEQYCENIFHLVENLHQPTVCVEKFELAKMQLEELKQRMEQELPDRKEIVFFPYRADLWDSLEGMYRILAEDEDNDVYCVPIPYYDLNKDKSLGALHDEGSEYPQDILTVDWKEYDFELRKPDAIYIHNPYDNWMNEVSVDSRYYASNLRQYTEELVYVPPFALDDIKPDDEVAIENMRHFCFLPGIIQADKVIVQSENMRRIYINEYVKAAEEWGMEVDEEAVETKIVGIGSTMFANLQEVKSITVELPEEWEQFVEKAKGEQKKIVLYHTGVNDLLYYGSKLFAKMEETFQVFEQHRKNIVVWWFPHPMIEKVVKDRNQELWIEFQKMVERYRESGLGIYDESGDLDRAVAVTDAYYGDWNTMVWKYQKLGKPVMLENVNILSE